MAQKDPETGPSLELPSLFGRRRPRGEHESAPADTAVDERSLPPVEEPVDVPAPPVSPDARIGRRRAAPRSLPAVAASTAAFLVGALVGLLGCALTYLGLQGCEAITGTGSCGGPGLLVLAVILVVMVLAGAVALRGLAVPEPGNVSFLGVGVMTVVALVFLVDYLYDPWMFLVVPVVTAVCFAVARWVTTLYAEDLDNDDDGLPHHDIR